MSGRVGDIGSGLLSGAVAGRCFRSFERVLRRGEGRSSGFVGDTGVRMKGCSTAASMGTLRLRRAAILLTRVTACSSTARHSEQSTLSSTSDGWLSRVSRFRRVWRTIMAVMAARSLPRSIMYGGRVTASRYSTGRRLNLRCRAFLTLVRARTASGGREGGGMAPDLGDEMLLR